MEFRTSCDGWKGARGEKLLFYPQMTQMTQIFLGCVIRGKRLRGDKGPKGWNIKAQGERSEALG